MIQDTYQYQLKIKETADYLKAQLPGIPQVAVMLGSGLGGLVEHLEILKTIDYKDIPNFPQSSVQGHAGKLVYGKASKNEVCCFQGRWHYYEGYPLEQVTFYVRVLKELGVPTLVVTNAAGGLQAGMQPGDIMLITDHINMMGDNPLLGPNREEWGPRFPDMTHPYHPAYCKLAKETAAELGITLREGVYCVLSGPNYETQAEIKMLKILGADAVGMSTVPEVLVARQAGLKVLGFSAITDVIQSGEQPPVTHAEVLKVAREMGERFTKLVIEILKKMD